MDNVFGCVHSRNLILFKIQSISPASSAPLRAILLKCKAFPLRPLPLCVQPSLISTLHLFSLNLCVQLLFPFYILYFTFTFLNFNYN